MSDSSRPLSPHLTVYRWPITMLMSILHRATGVALALGFVALVVWLESIASGEATYATVSGWARTSVGQLLLLGWSFAFFFHLANGIRHLFWDAGLGFEKSQARASSWLVIAASTLLTAIYWLLLQA
jgi:succinate dehydrogenase / fumarate reductase cytochrome b subunit